MPLALRREYARAAAGESAWDIAALDDDIRGALEAVAVMGIPIAPAAVAGAGTRSSRATPDARGAASAFWGRGPTST